MNEYIYYRNVQGCAGILLGLLPAFWSPESCQITTGLMRFKSFPIGRGAKLCADQRKSAKIILNVIIRFCSSDIVIHFFFGEINFIIRTKMKCTKAGDFAGRLT